MTEKSKIFIVEDSKTQLIHLENLLVGKNYTVVTAPNGKKALEKLEQFIPDVILSDILMPEMDGYEFCSRVRSNEKWKDIPIVLLTALNDPQDVIRGLNVGADNFIPKPFSSEFLISRIENLLENKRLRSAPLSGSGAEIFFAGKKHAITSDRMQIIDLLLSTYENAVNKNNELIKANLELIELKEDLEKKNILLEKSNEEKNRFIGIAAHDLRNPLGAIYSFTEILEDELKDTLDESMKEVSGYIKDSVDSMLKLVEDLLDVSKIEAGKLEIAKQEEDIVSLVKRNIFKNKFLAEKKNIKIIEEFDNNEIIMNFDVSRIEQVLNNLISNAIKYSEPGTFVYINLSADDKLFNFSIRDNGVGIKKDELHKLFKPFSKTSAITTAGESSTGLGLFTCKKIIEGHKGEIGAQSEYGKGSTFFFSIPLFDKVEKKHDEISNVEIKSKILIDKRILVVDDIDVNFSYFKSVLSKYSVNLTWSKSGQEAINLCKENEYDLILMDIHLPGMNGLETTQKIRTFNKKVIIICQTAYYLDGLKEKCLDAGANAYMTMPVKPDNVIKIVAENIIK